MILEVEYLTKKFGSRFAVDDVSFQIKPGTIYGLLGPNGAGKTTTISMVCGILEPDAGTVRVDGHLMSGDAPEARNSIGYVPQSIALYPSLSARENLKFFGRLYGMRSKELEGRTAEVLEQVGLAERGDDRISEYSGGMQRRVNIACGLLHRPKLIVCDEPTVGVDAQSRNAIIDVIEDLTAGGTAVLYTTHYMEEAERLCDRVGIIDNGRLLKEGTVKQLKRGGKSLEEVFLSLTGRTLRD